MAEAKISPLTDRPLNLPGQSVDRRLGDFVDNHFALPMMFVLSLSLFSLWEWVAYLRHLPRQPWLFMSLSCGALIAVLAYWRFKWNEAIAIRLGRDGERAVGQFLDTHVEADATVFHDVPTVKGNIDHVIICTRGVYAVETKTRSKPTKTNPEILVENDRLAVAGYPPDRDPMTQARACADDLRQVLQASTGKPFNVQPVVVFPGWYIEDRREQKSSVWVLEPKGLSAWIKRDAQTINESDVSMATYHLSRYIRTFVR